jgi:hypothetical protein
VNKRRTLLGVEPAANLGGARREMLEDVTREIKMKA